MEFPFESLIDSIKKDPIRQLEIIRHFLPQAIPNKRFKLHDEKTASSTLKLYEGKYWIKNFGSSEKAQDCFNIAQERLGCDMPELLRYLKSNFFSEHIITSSVSKLERSSFEKQVYAIKCNDKSKATKYLEGRGVDTSSLLSDSYYQNNNTSGVADGIIFLDSKEKLINKRLFKPSELIRKYCNKGKLDGAIYDKCYDNAKESVFICEGVLNSLSLSKIGSSIALFSASNNVGINKLKEYIVNKEVILALDNDRAGEAASDRILAVILDSNIDILSIKKLLLPEKKDCNDLLKSGGLREFLEDKRNYQQLYPDFIPDSDNEKDDLLNKGYFIRGSCYYVEEGSGNRLQERRISNFVMKSIYFMNSGQEEAHRIFLFQNRLGETKYMTIPYFRMTLNCFKAIAFKGGGFSFKGTPSVFDEIMEDMVENKTSIHEVDVLGYQFKQNVYAFSNGVIEADRFAKADRLGVSKTLKSMIYLPASSFINRDSLKFINQRKFIYRKGEIDFQKWSKLFYEAYQEKAVVGICFTIGAIFRDIVFKELGFYPYLFLFGDYGVGKTTYTELFLNLFGNDLKGISLEGGSTSKSVARYGSQYRNSIIYLKELTNKIEGNIQGFLKTGYEGVGYSMAQKSNDNKTHDIYLLSAIILDGNYIPSLSSALYSRMLILNFKNHQFTKEETDAFNELNNQSKIGVGQILLEIFSHRESFAKSFRKVFRTIYPEIKYQRSDTKGFSERNVKHTALLLSIYKIMEGKLKFPVLYSKMFDTLISMAKEQDEGLQRISELNQFWEAIEFLKSENRINSNHYKILIYEDKDLIALSLKLVYPLYRKFCISQNKPDLDQNTLLALLKYQKYFYPSWQKGRVDSHTVKSIGSTYLFDFNQLPLEKELWLR